MKKTFSILANYISLSLSVIFITFLLRVYEFFLVIYKFGDTAAVFKWMSLGLYYDIIIALCYLSILIFPYVIISLKFPKTATILFKTITTLLIVIAVTAINYYGVTKLVLDDVIFAYPIGELINISAASNDNPIICYFMFIVFPTIFIFSPFKNSKPSKLFIVLGLILIFSGFFLKETIQLKRLDVKKDYISYTTHKTIYFIQSLIKHYNKPDYTSIDDQEILALSKRLSSVFPEQIFCNSAFPFLHREHTKNSLGSYFEFKSKPPNVVIIIVESLSRSFSGENPKCGHFTPFLDSLSKHALSWNNCLSTSQRTFGVLPSFLGSLPFGETGFLDYRLNVPDHYTLIDYLKTNHYFTAFYYGGWLEFDHMHEFLKYHNVDNILNDWSGYEEYRDKKSNFAWGYSDKDVFKRAMELRQDSENPRLDIYLTLSSHEPWTVRNQEKYENIFDELADKQNITDDQILQHRSKFATFVYTDDALRQLLNSYKETKEYENTIFIITGDHQISFVPYKNTLEKYHVPLIVYSPLLKKSGSFNSVVSHRNVTPTLIALLNDQFSFKSNDEVAWLSTALDTTKTFRSVGFSPFMKTNRNIDEILYRNYYYNDNTVYEIEDNLDLKPVDDQFIIDSITRIHTLYNKLDNYICNNNRVTPNLYTQENISLKSFIEQEDTTETYINANIKYPRRIIEYTLSENNVSIDIDFSFDILLEEKNSIKNTLLVAFSIDSKNTETAYFTSWSIGNKWYGNYNKWFHFSKQILLKQETHNYSEGDILKVYILNSKKASGRIKNVKTKISQHQLQK